MTALRSSSGAALSNLRAPFQNPEAGGKKESGKHLGHAFMTLAFLFDSPNELRPREDRLANKVYFGPRRAL